MESVALGQTIKELREEKGLTQEQLANMLHISRQNVSRWELGKRSIESTNLLKICQILGVTLDELALKAVNKSSAKKEKNNYTDFIEKQNESDLINSNIKDDKKKSVKQKTNRSPISVNKNDIYNIVVNLYDDKNQESKKRKKYFRLFISSMVLMVILIIFFIIFSLYNAVSIYNINGSGSSIDIVNGLFVITRDKIYFDLGSIRNKTKNEIRELELYYYNKNNYHQQYVIQNIIAALYFVTAPCFCHSHPLLYINLLSPSQLATLFAIKRSAIPTTDWNIPIAVPKP